MSGDSPPVNRRGLLAAHDWGQSFCWNNDLMVVPVFLSGGGGAILPSAIIVGNSIARSRYGTKYYGDRAGTEHA
jgi:hypothetical protein